ncbi:hypothetical protein BTJ40_10255 [Microbulbifer sp. A4B17]|uniref:DoxX family protein n=1 Tax=Microbulbifer sp. A4B17 TaxID=359370 RepID=UPI000D52F07D|nr:hypothetical protein [Microbulbifer sp. A4B17]AWF81169.1 hypothetical protein BTJ40_10255 [Microbulbifer sp. A4B17]
MTTPIIILSLLCSPLLVAFLFSKVTKAPLHVGSCAFWGLGLAFIFFSIGHFVKTEGMIQMLPSWAPYRGGIIYLTGMLELLVGILLFLPKWQKNAAKVAIVILIAFFPANIYSALNSVGLGGHQWGAIYLLIRAPLQIILVVWAYFLCVKSHDKVLNPIGHKVEPI